MHYMQRQCTEFGKLALAGMTFLFASGDNGVASNSANLCLLKNGTAADAPGNFPPNFPATCPYVTAVGSTQVDAGKSVRDPESATSTFGSGGGFSNVFPRADFQKDAVAGYLANHVPALPEGIYNASGRGFPDVAANGLNYSIAVQGELILISGTSASSPTLAALFTAINDARLAAGKGPVGWLNPVVRAALPSVPAKMLNAERSAAVRSHGYVQRHYERYEPGLRDGWIQGIPGMGPAYWLRYP